MTYATITDARTGKPITGKILREYSNGLTIEDANGVMHYATFSRVIDRTESRPVLTVQTEPQMLAPRTKGDIFND